MGSEVRNYYSEAHVRERIGNFLRCRNELSAQAVTHQCDPPEARPPHLLWENLQVHDELHRSLWDRHGLLAHLDIEHVHFQDPWYSWDHIAEAFQAQEPVVRRALELLEGWGIRPLHILTGRGHHLIWRIDAESDAFTRIGKLAPLHSAQKAWYRDHGVPQAWGEGHLGLGLLLEYFGHQLIHTPAPLRIGLTACRSAEVQLISVDLSGFGDPLDRRWIRIPYSICWKAWEQARYLARDRELPWLVNVPLAQGEPTHPLETRSLEQARRRSRSVDCTIPSMSEGTLNLYREYRESGLAHFHREYYSTDYGWQAPRHAELPPCATNLLCVPRDGLLKPAGLRHVVRCLLAKGWRARCVAELIASRFRDDCGWIPGVHFHEPFTRADFYVRLFSGLIYGGLDALQDLDCASLQNQGLCPDRNCPLTLRDWRRDLKERLSTL